MKNFKFLLVTGLVVLLNLQASAQVQIDSYFKKDGSFVQSHYRSTRDANPYNNYSFPGNSNPFTGKTATGNTDTYLKNYDSKSSQSSWQSSNSLYKAEPLKLNNDSFSKPKN